LKSSDLTYPLLEEREMEKIEAEIDKKNDFDLHSSVGA
jgi:hypothetical protein